MLKYVFYFFIIGILVSCKMKSGKEFLIDGNIQGIKTPFVYLMYSVGDSMVTDTAEVKNGSFHFDGIVNEPAFGAIQIGEEGQVSIVVENGKMEVKGSMDSLDKVAVNGGPTQTEYNDYKSSFDHLISAQRRIFKSMSEDGNEALRAEAIQKLTVLNQELNASHKKYIGEHPKSYVSLIFLNNLSQEISYEEFEKYFKSLDPSLQSSALGKRLVLTFDKVKNTSVGGAALDFTQNDLSGNPVQLSSFKGKYVLLDFWASWCKPCREENPSVLKAYNQFKDKNFTVLGVSLDAEDAEWKKAVKEDGMPWTQLSDLKGGENEAARLYGIEAIPANFLISPEGIIIAKDLRGEDLIKKLGEVMK
ncbi:MAG: AhpC/TSA family protein [Bacteroidia bacterium]|nr:MAG: AhpC/TSA family protein [Bacteroidia bacterium]